MSERPAAGPDPAPTRPHESALFALMVNDENQQPWSVHEVTLELGDPVASADAIAGLRAAGLIHETNDGFVFATRAAIRSDAIRD